MEEHTFVRKDSLNVEGDKHISKLLNKDEKIMWSGK